MKILITGFEPFGEETVNPSIEVVQHLPATILTADIIPLEIPVQGKAAIEKITEAVNTSLPDAIISIGQAGGRAAISVERVSINIDDYHIPDNGNNQPVDVPIIDGAPAAYFATLPIRAMVDHIKAHGIPARISNTAGTFVCNHVSYRTAHFAASYPHKQIKTGFIHIPFLPEQAVNKATGAPSMSLETSIHGIILAIEAIIEHWDTN